MAHVIIFVHSTAANLGDAEAMENGPMGGSEASAFRMSVALQALGHRVMVTSRLEDLYRGCDVFIATRVWQLFARRIRPGRLCYLWCTDDADQPLVQPLSDPAVAAPVFETADGIMLLSAYQIERWQSRLHLPAEKVFATRNGIPVARFDPAPLAGRPPHAYYGSTPFRGLDRLIDSWPRVKARVPAAELHIFSSMGVYGAEDPPEYRQLYQRARSLPDVNYHGAQGQKTIRATSRTCRALAYPCTFPETSCITAMEAMASGCAVVSTATGALPETAADNPLVTPSDGWISEWEDALVRMLTDDAAYEAVARQNLEKSAARDWAVIAGEWMKRFGADAARRGVRI